MLIEKLLSALLGLTGRLYENFGWQLFVVHWIGFTNSAETDSY